MRNSIHLIFAPFWHFLHTFYTFLISFNKFGHFLCTCTSVRSSGTLLDSWYKWKYCCAICCRLASVKRKRKNITTYLVIYSNFFEKCDHLDTSLYNLTFWTPSYKFRSAICCQLSPIPRDLQSIKVKVLQNYLVNNVNLSKNFGHFCSILTFWTLFFLVHFGHCHVGVVEQSAVNCRLSQGICKV